MLCVNLGRFTSFISRLAILAWLLLFSFPWNVAFAETGKPVKRTILAFYNSQDSQDIRVTRIHRFAEMPLNHLGLVVKYRDIQKNMPSTEEMSDVRGVITWFQMDTMPNPLKYIQWVGEMVDRGVHFVILGNPGVNRDLKGKETPFLKISEFLGKLGLRTEDNWKAMTYDVRLILKDRSMVEFERPFNDILAPFQQIWSADKNSKVYLKASWGEDSKSTSDLVVVGPKGGYVAEGYSFFQSGDFQQWFINPFEFFRLAFATDDLPKPDPNTLSGQRIYYSHIDGDGWRNRSEIEKYKIHNGLSTEVILKEVFEAFPGLPVTVAPIVADLDPEWFGTDETRSLARKIFTLPHIEAGSHTYSHPYDWQFFSNYRAEVEWNAFVSKTHANDNSISNRYAPFISSSDKNSVTQLKSDNDDKEGLIAQIYEVPRAYNNFPFNLEREIKGSAEFISKFLPPGKTVEVLQWSGNCTPFIEAIKEAYSFGLLNINGGDTRFDPEFPSHSWVSPVGAQLGDQLQIYASASNENTYTELWEDRYFGFKHLIHTLRNTESPRRLKPINIYYHMYSGEKQASLNALLENIRYAQGQNITPITTSHFLRIAKGFFSTRLIKEDFQTWRIENRGGLQTIRFDQAMDKAVDLEKSKGVIGQHHYHNSLYISLDSANPSPLITLKEKPVDSKSSDSDRPFLIQGRWHIWNFKFQEPKQVSFNAQGFGEGEMVWNVPWSGAYELQVSDETGIKQTLTETPDSNGILKFKFSSLALDVVKIVIRRLEKSQ